ncbi:MAG: hypothetical protein CMO80_15465 [Verrucomicrobiales bacterium]|nr:hypothetical protein [Verrucomicrobiales bacterium]
MKVSVKVFVMSIDVPSRESNDTLSKSTFPMPGRSARSTSSLVNRAFVKPNGCQGPPALVASWALATMFSKFEFRSL